MGKIIRLTEADLTRLVKRVIREQKSSRPLLTEAAAQMAIDDAEDRIANGETPDPAIMKQVKQCITQKQLTSLMFLTTSAGAYALGIIAMLIMSGVGSEVGFAAGGILALSSIIVLFITGLSEKVAGKAFGENSPLLPTFHPSWGFFPARERALRGLLQP